MEAEHKTRLTASEISSTWSSYQNNTFSTCILKYFLANVEDEEVKSILEFAFTIAEKSVQTNREILQKNDQPIPVGFTSEDVSPMAPRLYSDTFYLYFIKNMSKVGVSIYGVALATAAQSDVRRFLSQAISSTTELYNKTADVLLKKGLFIRPPYVSAKDGVDFIDKRSYLGGILTLNKRPLNVIEITHLHANAETNIVGQTLLTGLAQVAKSQKVREYCFRGKEIAKKHIELFSSLLIQDDLSASTAWDVEISNSTTAPFSDKLIMFQTALLNASGISNYATASAASMRMDIASDYARLSVEIAQFALDGAKILIDNGWLEQPPQTADRKKLAKV
jgi:spore coat protein CotF